MQVPIAQITADTRVVVGEKKQHIQLIKKEGNKVQNLLLTSFTFWEECVQSL